MAHVYIELNISDRDSLLKFISLYVDSSLINDKKPVEEPHITLLHTYDFERSLTILRCFNSLTKQKDKYSFEISDIVVTEDVIYALVQPLENNIKKLIDFNQILHITLALWKNIKPIAALHSARNLNKNGTLKLSCGAICEGELKIKIF